MRVAVAEGDVEHPPALPVVAALVDFVRGTVERGGRGDEHRQHDEVHDRGDLAADGPDRHVNRLVPALVAVHVRVLVNVEQRGRMLDHAIRHVDMEVEGRDDRYACSDLAAHCFEDGSLDVVDPLGGPGAVEGEADRVNLARLANAGEELGEHAIERRTLDRAGGVGRRREARNELDLSLFGGVDHAPEVGPHPPVLLDDLHSAQPLLPLKLLDRGRRPEHRVRLVTELTDGDAHGVILLVPAERSVSA